MSVLIFTFLYKNHFSSSFFTLKSRSLTDSFASVSEFLIISSPFPKVACVESLACSPLQNTKEITDLIFLRKEGGTAGMDLASYSSVLYPNINLTFSFSAQN